MNEADVLQSDAMTHAEYKKRQQREVDENYAAMQEMLGGCDGCICKHRGRYALMKDRKVVEFFDTGRDAVTAGNMLFSDRVFSVQKVGREVLHLGMLSCA